MAERPPHGWTTPIPDGYEVVAAPAPGWRVATGKLCRRMTRQYVYCRAPSVAEVNRSVFGKGNNWWAYCADHLYGHWIEDGRVMVWRLQEIGASDG